MYSFAVCNFGQEWEVAHIHTKTPYRAGLKREIEADIGVKIGLRSVNITLKSTFSWIFMSSFLNLGRYTAVANMYGITGFVLHVSVTPTKDTPYLDLRGDLSGIHCEYFVESSSACSSACLRKQQRKHQGSTLLALCDDNPQWPMRDAPHKGPVIKY